MPDISSVGHGAVGPVDRITSTARIDDPTLLRDGSRNGTGARAPERHGDRVELSDHARFLDQVRRLPDVRTDRIDEIRTSIQDGSYETDAKLDVAVGRLIDDLLID